MPTVHLPPQLAKLAGGARVVEVEGKTLMEAIESLEKAHPGLRDKLVDGERVRTGMAVAIDSVLGPQSLRQPIGERSEVHFIPAMQGG
jgi:molybdopterin converting factor small subunit